MIRGLPIKDHWSEQRMFIGRAIAAAVIAALLLLFVVARLIVLQIVNYEHFVDLSHGNRVRIEPVQPTRGLIFDRNGILLAENVPAYQLELVPEQVADLEDTLRRLTADGLLRPEDGERVRRLIASKRRFDAVPLRYRLSEEEVARFSVQRQDYPGVDIRARLARHYPLGATAVHAIGYVASMSPDDLKRLDSAAYSGTTHVGKVGIEKAYEHKLHGAAGHQQVLVNAQGRALQVTTGKAPLPGADLYLTLDVTMQLAAERALGERRGAVVAIDPHNGDVLVLASTPGYDPNPFGEGLSGAEYRALSGDKNKPLFNRALRGNYPPGSTIKPMLGLAALHHHIGNPWEHLMCPGYFMLPGNDHRYRDWKREGHGPVNLTDSIAQSCDVYFYELALELGINRMHDFLAQFGFGETTGIDIQGEKSGLLPSREWKRRALSEAWFPGETIITGIGQGFMLSTPLQLANATAAVAARGQRFAPALVHAVRDPVSGVTTTRTPEPLEPVEIADPEHWHHIVAAMDEVVNGLRGTARAIGVDSPMRIAGKTGTAQVFTVAQDADYNADEVDDALRHHALFIGFAPLEYPQVAVAVLVENGGSGSAAAAPVAREVLDAWYTQEQLRAAARPQAALP